MFLSTENPPNDPLSSSSHFAHLTTSPDELGQSHLHNFSIRDYAYSNRKNNIKNNWPFSHKSLQLFSSHGVTDPLPPFQRFSTLSNQFETTPSSSSGKQTVSYVQRGRDLAKLGLNQTIPETGKGICSQPRIIENGLLTSTSVSKSKEEIVVAATSNNNNKNNHSKKSGRGGGMVKSKEDSSGGLVTNSDSIMASKTCPICKTFSSASNTTLNAHIDQCLSADAAVLPVSTKPNKPRVNQSVSVESAVPPVSSKPCRPRGKPRMKVKTMVDIYASAKGCTLEDLDKRNGTQWVSILSYTNRAAADKSEVSRKRKVSPVGVGPVYIDAKGQKLRILTEFSERKTSITPWKDQQEDGSNEKKSLSQGSKENSKSSRKRRRGKKHHKYLKLTNHKANASEIPEYQRGLSEEGSSKGHRRIYNQRMLAKRGVISKKLNEKGHKFYALRDQPSEDDDDEWSGGDPLVLRGTDTDSSPLNKQKLRNEVSRRNKTMFESKRARSSSFRVRMSEKEEKSLAGAHLNTVRLKKSLSSIQEDKYQRGKNFCSNVREVSDASPRANSMRKVSPPIVANGWRRLSLPVELKRARLDLSEEEEEEDEEETGKWESEMTQERELSDDDYVSGDNGEINEVLRRSKPSFSDYDDYDDDDDEENSEEEEDNNKRANVLDKTDDMSAEFYQSDTPPSNEIIPDERAMYYSEEVGHMVYGQNTCEEDVRFDSEVGKGSLFVEVDTIPIPGPPGSFLPSPRDMGFEENLGNSSVITSQIQSSMDQLDRNSSESPVSAVSNFAAGRLNFPAELSSSFQENFSPDIPSSYSTTPMSFSVPSHHVTVAEAELMTVDKTTPLSFRNNGRESCCCQRKERISEGITLNHQESHLLQRRAAASSSVAMNLTKSPTRLDPNHPFQQSPYMIQQEFDLHSKFSNKANFNSAVPPSPSNPVLRLMGKDLMVMNQGEADNEEVSQASLKPAPQYLDPPPCAGSGLYFNTGLYLRNSFESTHQTQPPKAQAQAPTQASPFRNNFDHVRYFSPS